MKNLVNESPFDVLCGKKLFDISFVADEDIKNKAILDVGCGFGWFEVNAAKRGCQKIIGTEPEEKYLETARKDIRADSVSFAVGSAVALPFPDDCFDTVVSFEVIEHLPKKTEEKMFQEAARVLKKGGVFYMSTMYDCFLSKITDPAWWLIGHRHYGRQKLAALGKGNGFEVEKMMTKGAFWEVVAIGNLYAAKWIFRRRPFFERTINRFLDKEYQKEKGFTNIFVKFRKI